MYEFRSRGRTLALSFLLVLSLLLSTLEVRADSWGVLRVGLGSWLVPLQRLAVEIFDPLVATVEGLAGIASLRSENAALRAQLAETQAEMAAVEDQLARLDSLERLVDLDLPDVEQTRTLANVVGRQVGFEFHLRIDKGLEEGVVAGNPVLDENGYLLGRVGASAEEFATVIPLSADVEGLTVLVAGSVGVLRPQVGSELLSLEVVDSPPIVAEGEDVVTSQLSVSFPPGLPVGSLVGEAQVVGSVLRGTVKPFSDPQRARAVLVVSWPPGPNE